MKKIAAGLLIIIGLILASIVIAKAQPAPGPVKKDSVVHYTIVRAMGVTLRLTPADVAYVRSFGMCSVNRMFDTGAPFKSNEQADFVVTVMNLKKAKLW